MPEEHYFLIASNISLSEHDAIKAEDIAVSLLRHGFWAVGDAVPFIRKISSGDRVLVYVAGRGRRFFIAHGLVSSSVRLLEADELGVLEQLGLPFFRSGFGLEQCTFLASQVPIKPLVDQFSFMTDKKNYGLHLRFPIVHVAKDDFEKVINQCCGKGCGCDEQRI